MLFPIQGHFYRPSDLWKNTQFADGGIIPDSIIHLILRAYEEHELDIVWQQGDALYIDNMLASHGRKPFSD